MSPFVRGVALSAGLACAAVAARAQEDVMVVFDGSNSMWGQIDGTAKIEITAAAVSLTAPDTALAGSSVPVGWTGTVSTRDYINIVPAGAPEGEFGNYFSVRDKTGRDMTAPGTTGMYELRYILRAGPRVLARKPVEVLAEDAALNTGASLTAPKTAAADQAIFTWIAAVKITGAPPVTLTLPDAPGAYELRFLDVSNQKILARKAIAVK